mmetsp:Transcript_15670/g.31652  ORF Transcript_15670/g.31652 Transcript_15670/m.31652 type:complete len:256 (-) Transcript_15670:261-1028(-)
MVMLSSVASTFASSMRFQTGGLFAVRLNCSCALPQTFRHSGSETSSLARSRAGSNTGTNASTSYGSSTSLDMFSMMRAQLRLVAVTGSSRPRLSSGAMSASEEPKTSWTKTQPARSCTVSGTFSGAKMHAITNGTNSLMSVFLSHAKAAAIAAEAASFTCALVSHISPESTGTTFSRQRDICFGALVARVESSSARSKLTCHLPSPSARMAGRTEPSASGESPLTSALAARSASTLTGFILSATAAMTSDRSATM